MGLYEKIHAMRAVNTHSHHMPDAFFKEMNLETLLMNSYVSWCGLSPGESSASRQAYLDAVRYKSYFVWLMKAVQKMYEIEEDLSPYNWDGYSKAIREANADPAWHKAVLSVMCGYDKLIVDAYWEPGFCGDDKIFTSTFRIDALLFGYLKDAANHNGNGLFSLYGKKYTTIDTYMRFVRKLIREKAEGGCVALKCAMAYDRPIDFEKTTKAQASKAFSAPTPANIKRFQDYAFFQICKLAGELDLPVQVHTGLGQLKGTGAMNLHSVIEAHPNTKFVLFHGGFPWTGDVLALLHNFPNVYADICWLPLLSPTMAVTTLHALIEVGTADKICWGCDTWTSEESLGARMAADFVVNKTLEEKMRDGYLTQTDAMQLGENILRRNAKALYGL